MEKQKSEDIDEFYHYSDSDSDNSALSSESGQEGEEEVFNYGLNNGADDDQGLNVKDEIELESDDDFPTIYTQKKTYELPKQITTVKYSIPEPSEYIFPLNQPLLAFDKIIDVEPSPKKTQFLSFQSVNFE